MHFQIKEAIFHYQTGARWELGISTPEQREAAWKYGHDKLVLLDGTFNISDKNVLLFVVMVIDESWKGMFAQAGVLLSCDGPNAHVSVCVECEELANTSHDSVWQGCRWRTFSSRHHQGRKRATPTMTTAFWRGLWRHGETVWCPPLANKASFFLQRYLPVPPVCAHACVLELWQL